MKNINIKNFPMSCTSQILENYKSPYNATVINRIIKEKGAIVAKANMDEFAMGSSTEYSSFGVVSNPKNINKVVSKDGYPNSDKVMRKGVLLPLHHGMTDSMFDRLHSTITDFIRIKT